MVDQCKLLSLEGVAKLSATIELEADRVRLWNKRHRYGR